MSESSRWNHHLLHRANKIKMSKLLSLATIFIDQIVCTTLTNQVSEAFSHAGG